MPDIMARIAVRFSPPLRQPQTVTDRAFAESEGAITNEGMAAGMFCSGRCFLPDQRRRRRLPEAHPSFAVPAMFEVRIALRFIFLLTLESVPGCILYTERIGTSRKSAIRRSRQTNRGEHGHAPTL